MLTVRRVTIAFIVGGGVGAYGSYNLEHYNTEHLGSLADRGYCAARDVDHNRYWYACQDAFIAAQLQQQDAARAQESLAAINEAELAKQPRKVRAPKEPIPAKLFAR
jgi:hypothetical protein